MIYEYARISRRKYPKRNDLSCDQRYRSWHRKTSEKDNSSDDNTVENFEHKVGVGM